MEFTAMLALGTLVFAAVNFLKYLRVLAWPDRRNRKAAEWKAERWEGFNGALTQLISWACGVAAVFLVAETQFAADIDFGGRSLAEMNGGSKLFIGLIATSLLTTFNEVKKAIDNSDSARKPSLLRGVAPDVETNQTSLHDQIESFLKEHPTVKSDPDAVLDLMELGQK